MSIKVKISNVKLSILQEREQLDLFRYTQNLSLKYFSEFWYGLN